MIYLPVKICRSVLAMLLLCSFFFHPDGFCQTPQTVSDRLSFREICVELEDGLIDAGFENVSVSNAFGRVKSIPSGRDYGRQRAARSKSKVWQCQD